MQMGGHQGQNMTELIKESTPALPDILMQAFDVKQTENPSPSIQRSDTMASAFSAGFQLNPQHFASLQAQAQAQAHLLSLNPHSMSISPSAALTAAGSYGSFQLPYQFPASTFNMQRSVMPDFSMGTGQKPQKSQSTAHNKHHDGEEDVQMAMKRPRLIWTKQLHERFVEAVNKMGVDQAVPKAIMESMNVKGITRENVASHLQKYRAQLKKNKNNNIAAAVANNTAAAAAEKKAHEEPKTQ